SVKLEQGMELPIPQEELLMLKESNVIKDKEILQESCKDKIKTNCKQISMLDKENLQRNKYKKKAAASKAFYFNTKFQWELKPVFETIQEMVDNRNKNLQKDISDRIKHKLMKEQDKETSKARSKVIKISKENPYMNSGSASTLIVFGSVDEPVGLSSRASGVDTNRKRLLQKELTLKIAQIYEPIKCIQNTWFQDILSEITKEEWYMVIGSLKIKIASGIS
ncbi:43940_t:CDS:2, partial [Gigaspora margarita]